jgi:hypothetical protein
MEAGIISEGCAAPIASDEVHLFHDLNAIIQPGAWLGAGALPPLALLISSLRSTAPLMLLNVSLGDQAVLGRRDCHCPLGAVGWSTNLHAIRSFEKLTAGGITLLDTDAVRALEEVLPRHFGGGPVDYQLQEGEDAGGAPTWSWSSVRALASLIRTRSLRCFSPPSAQAPGPSAWPSCSGVKRACSASSVASRSPVPPARSCTATPLDGRPNRWAESIYGHDSLRAPPRAAARLAKIPGL